MRINELREQRGVTQRQVADALGCSPVTFLRYESGEREPNITRLIQLADFFGVTIDYLVGRDTVSDATETEMLSLYRAADERAKKDAMSLLSTHGK